jgi:SAM-dependent methyltransferase
VSKGTMNIEELVENTPNLNLGCGENLRSGFVNTDICLMKGVDLILDARDLSVFQDETFSYIVAEHLLEYIPRKDIVSALREWYRVLAEKGHLEIRVTDISSLTKAMYLHSISNEMGMHDEMVIALLYGQQSTLDTDVRYSGFTSSYLQGILKGCGYKVVSVVVEEVDVIITSVKP